MLFMFSLILDPPLHPYEEERLRQCMMNNSRLQQLGIPALVSMCGNINSISRNKKPNNRDNEDSESEYDPSHDDSIEGDLFDHADHNKVMVPPSY